MLEVTLPSFEATAAQNRWDHGSLHFMGNLKLGERPWFVGELRESATVP
jgi:hypothetical protein